ncbi:MAG: hypothetical protein DRQ49_09770 [Gammaproteobacteria bacterium]|nr:MAG: hypothetical protein DRQ49_09770 [Gammaproteobacteria bacterium]RKZ42781.1 MAG: hypothetical protein DRQ41_06560 [Gammaproteobacteria bacterium]
MKKTQEIKKSTTQTSTSSYRTNHSKQQRYGLSAHTGIVAGGEEGLGFVLCRGIQTKEQGYKYLEGLYND